MAMARKEKEDYARKAYRHAIEELLGDKIGGKIDNALTDAGCQGDIRKIVTLRDEDIEKLRHEVGKGADKTFCQLAVGSKVLVRILKAFYCYKINDGAILNDTWPVIDPEEFEMFRMMKYRRNQSYELINSPPITAVVDRSHTMEISRHHDIKGFRVIVGEIFNGKGKHIPMPSEVLSLKRNNTRISIAHLCQRYPSDIGGSKFFLHALQVFVKTCDIDDDWANVALAEFNEFLIDRGFNPLEGVITELLHDGISMFSMIKASIRIQSSLRKFSACLRRKRMIHSTMMIRRCLSNYIHRKVKKNLVCSVIKIQSFIRGYHIRNTMEDSNCVAVKIQAIHRGSGLQFKCMKYCGAVAKTLLQRLLTQEMVVEFSGRPGIKRKAVDGLYKNTMTMIGGPYIINSKTLEQHNATLLLLLIRFYYSLPPAYMFFMVKKKVPPDKEGKKITFGKKIKPYHGCFGMR